MKRTVWTFGLLSGAVSSALMLLTVPFMDRLGFGPRGVVLGYTGIVASFLLVFFGVRAYRDQVGTLSFGRAFTVGILITLISSVCYVATWQLVYFKLKPGFADDYGAYVVAKTRASGASEAEVAQTTQRMREFKDMLDKPLLNAAITLIEPLPIGVLVTLISAAVLRSRGADQIR